MKKIFSKSVALSLIVAIVMLAAGCAKKSTEAGSTSQTGTPTTKKKIIVGTSADYPPYEFHAQINGEDKIVGFDMDIAQEIAKDMGAELEIKDMDFGGLLAALSAGKVDMVIAGMTPKEERKKSADFSDIYYRATHGIVMLKDAAAQLKSLDDLKGKVIGVQQGSIQADMAKDKIKDAKEIKEVPKITDLILMLQSGKVDAIVMERPVAESYVQTNDKIGLAALEMTDETGGSAVAVKKGNTEYVDQINKTIQRLVKEDKINQYLTEANKLADESKK